MRFILTWQRLRRATRLAVHVLTAEHAAGDHWIVVERVRRPSMSSDARPLVYFAGFQPH